MNVILTKTYSFRRTYSSVELSGWSHCRAEVKESPSSIEVTSKSISAFGVAARSSAVGGITEFAAKGAMLMMRSKDTRKREDRLRM